MDQEVILEADSTMDELMKENAQLVTQGCWLIQLTFIIYVYLIMICPIISKYILIIL